MSARKPRVNKRKAILTAIVAFVVVLAASILIQLFMSPGFKGFGREEAPPPHVTYVDEGDSSDSQGRDPNFNWQNHPVFIIGDSLTKGAAKEIEKTVAGATIDSRESRNMATGVQILQGWKDSGILADDAIIVICLANNITGTTVKDAQAIVDMIEPGQSLIMMTGHGLSNMAPANEFIRNLPNIYPFVTVADWDLTIAQSPNLLADDGIHIARSQGNVLYAELILRALEVAQPRP